MLTFYLEEEESENQTDSTEIAKRGKEREERKKERNDWYSPDFLLFGVKTQFIQFCCFSPCVVATFPEIHEGTGHIASLSLFIFLIIIHSHIE